MNLFNLRLNSITVDKDPQQDENMSVLKFDCTTRIDQFEKIAICSKTNCVIL
jgi:hypothetical protein